MSSLVDKTPLNGPRDPYYSAVLSDDSYHWQEYWEPTGRGESLRLALEHCFLSTARHYGFQSDDIKMTLTNNPANRRVELHIGYGNLHDRRAASHAMLAQCRDKPLVLVKEMMYGMLKELQHTLMKPPSHLTLKGQMEGIPDETERLKAIICGLDETVIEHLDTIEKLKVELLAAKPVPKFVAEDLYNYSELSPMEKKWQSKHPELWIYDDPISDAVPWYGRMYEAYNALVKSLPPDVPDPPGPHVPIHPDSILGKELYPQPGTPIRAPESPWNRSSTRPSKESTLESPSSSSLADLRRKASEVINGASESTTPTSSDSPSITSHSETHRKP